MRQVTDNAAEVSGLSKENVMHEEVAEVEEEDITLNEEKKQVVDQVSGIMG